MPTETAPPAAPYAGVRQAVAAPGRRALGPDWLLLAGYAAVAAVMVRAIWFTPLEARQGAAQKILYVHATSAFVALYLAFGLLAVTSALYLWLKDEKLDRVAESAAEVGLVFTSVVLITGPLWGKPVWGTWWTWDMRLTSTLFLWFLIVGYTVLRGAIDEPAMRARYSAVLGILAALLVPFIHLSVYMFRTLHPRPVILQTARPAMSSEMLTTFVAAFIAFTLLFAGMLRARYRLATRRDALALIEEQR